MRAQDKAVQIGKSGCLALCYIKLACMLSGMEASDPLIHLVMSFDNLVAKGIMDSDCYINDAEKFIKETTGLDVEVTKPTEYNSADPIIAYNNKHFVIIKGNDKNIVWNSMNNDDDWLRLPVKSYRQVKLKKTFH